MGKIKVNEIEKHDATEVTVNSDVVMAAGTSVSSPSISTDTISEKTSAAGVTIDGVLIKDSKIGGTITIPGSTGTMALTSDISAGGLTEADIWYLTAHSTSSADPISANLARASQGEMGNLGTGMSVSSGIWTFPSTGFYYIQFNALFYSSNAGSGGRGTITFETTSDNFSTETAVQQLRVFKDINGQNISVSASTAIIMDVENTSTHKIKFKQDTVGTASLIGAATSGDAITNIVFLKLGDT
jgi:hypothetical protein